MTPRGKHFRGELTLTNGGARKPRSKNPLAGDNLGHLASDRGEPEGGEKPSRPDSG